MRRGWLVAIAAALVGACATPPRASVYRTRATDLRALVRELRADAGRLLPELIPWPGPSPERDEAGRELEQLGYVGVGFDSDWSGAEDAFAWMLDPGEVGMLRSDECAPQVAAVLRRVGIPCCYPVSQGTYLCVPGPSLRRALAALRAEPSLDGMVAFAALQRPASVYAAAACTVPLLREELERHRAVHGALPDAVVADGLGGWCESGALDVPWVEAMGYEPCWCVYRIDADGDGVVGDDALMLRPRTVACVFGAETLVQACAALDRAGVPVSQRMSQTFYLDVPARRFERARRALGALQLGDALSVYPR